MKRQILMIMVIFILIPIAAFCDNDEDKGLLIATEADSRSAGFGNFTADMEMILKDRHGNISIRKVRSKTLEVIGDGDKSLSIFDSPKDVKGTAMLTFTHKHKPDDQWLYMPALKRVKRISSSNKSGSFMGSEFAYEDIASQEIEKYTYKWIRDEKYKEKECFVIERYPVDTKSGYTRQLAWIDKKEYNAIKIDFYDRKNYHLKTLNITGYNKYIEKYWYPDEMHMVNHQTGKETTIYWKNYKFLTGLRDKDFNKNSLKRVR